MKMWLARALFVTVLVTSLGISTDARQAAPARTFNPQDTLPFDSAVRPARCRTD